MKPTLKLLYEAAILAVELRNKSYIDGTFRYKKSFDECITEAIHKLKLKGSPEALHHIIWCLKEWMNDTEDIYERELKT